jgi:hypothetical protein
MTAQVTIRLAGDADARALAWLAALDSQRLPEGPVLIAEVEGEACAALPLREGAAIADPFRLTGEVRALLELRAAQLREEVGTRPSRGIALRERLRLRLRPLRARV